MKVQTKISATAAILLISLTGCGSSESNESGSSHAAGEGSGSSTEMPHPNGHTQLNDGYSSSETSEVFPDGVKLTTTDEEPEQFKKLKDILHDVSSKNMHFLKVESPEQPYAPIGLVALAGDDKDYIDGMRYRSIGDLISPMSSEYSSFTNGTKTNYSESDTKFLKEIQKNGLRETHDGKSVTYLVDDTDASTSIWNKDQTASSESTESYSSSSSSTDSEEPEDSPSVNPSSGWYSYAQIGLDTGKPLDIDAMQHDRAQPGSVEIDLRK